MSTWSPTGSGGSPVGIASAGGILGVQGSVAKGSEIREGPCGPSPIILALHQPPLALELEARVVQVEQQAEIDVVEIDPMRRERREIFFPARRPHTPPP